MKYIARIIETKKQLRVHLIHIQLLLKIPEIPLLPNQNHLINSTFVLLGCYKCCISRASAIVALLATSSYLSSQISLAQTAQTHTFVSAKCIVIYS